MVRKLGLAGIALTAVLGLSQPAHAVVYTFSANMDGPSESPANASPGTGETTVTYDSDLHTMRVQATFTGLTGTTTAAHIHAPTPAPFTLTAGVATQTPSFSGFPLGVTSGAMDTTFDLTQNTSWNAAYRTANGGTNASAEIAFFNAVTTGRSYFNIHTSSFNSGEIRGFLVPEPASALALAATSLLAMRRQRSVK